MCSVLDVGLWESARFVQAPGRADWCTVLASQSAAHCAALEPVACPQRGSRPARASLFSSFSSSSSSSSFSFPTRDAVQNSVPGVGGADGAGAGGADAASRAREQQLAAIDSAAHALEGALELLFTRFPGVDPNRSVLYSEVSPHQHLPHLNGNYSRNLGATWLAANHRASNPKSTYK